MWICLHIYVHLTCPVCLQMLIWVRGFEGSISRAAFLEAADLWPWPFLTGSPFCRIKVNAPLPLLRSQRLIEAANSSIHLTWISSRIPSTEPSLFPQKANAHRRLRRLRPPRLQTEKGGRSRRRWNAGRRFGTEVEEAYLHGLVVPAVRPVLLAPSSVQHQQGPVGVPQLQTTGLIQTHHAQAALQKGQRIPVSLIWMGRKGGQTTCLSCLEAVSIKDGV